MPRRSRCIRPSPSSTRACCAVWHLRPPSDSLFGAAVRAAYTRFEMPGFFAQGSRDSGLFRAAWLRFLRGQRPLAPCAHRLGEPTKSQNLGRTMSPSRPVRSSPDDRACSREPGSRNLVVGVSTHETLNPARLPRARLLDSIDRPAESLDTFNRGVDVPPFGFCLPVAPLLRPKMTLRLVQTGRLFVRWTVRLVTALQRSLVALSACLELVSTTDVSRHEHPRKHPFRRLPDEHCGKPANVRLRDRPRSIWLAPGLF